ncbi:MAG TPA: efflux transporter outer membrane subunit [Granulicella sp.]|jgi:multidrug efflux system outer membrane protein|nr:efflux transporter outer membrane subunit [Granulicella sp.]
MAKARRSSFEGRSASLTAIGLLTLVLSGCRVGPNYHAPPAPVPPAFTGATTTATPAQQAAISYSDWWKVFHDPLLDKFEVEADAANTDIRMALAHVDKAAAMTKFAQSYQMPTVGADPNVSRTRESLNRPNNGNTYGKAATYNDIQLPLVMNYEIDAWGRVRRTIEAARATQSASEDDLRFVRLATEATVAIDYYSLRESDQQLAVIDHMLVDMQQALDLTESLFQHGLSSDLEVAQAKTLLDQTAAQKQTLIVQRAQFEHALAVLLGRTAESLTIPLQPANLSPPKIPVGLPADLLTRRPDVAAADRQVAAANAQIGIAKAAYFPQLSLTGLVGYESSNAATLVNWQNTIASLGAGVTAPIFTGGRLRAGVEQAQAAYQASLAQYEKAVLVSYQQVEDQLTALRYLETQAHLQQLAIEDAQRTEQIALQRFKGGIDSYLTVVTAQQSVLMNEQIAAQIAGQREIDSVVLIKALGGGWAGAKHPDASVHRPSPT